MGFPVVPVVPNIETALRGIFLAHFGRLNKHAASAAMQIIGGLPAAANVPIYDMLLASEDYHAEMLIIVVVIGGRPIWSFMPAAQFRELD